MTTGFSEYQSTSNRRYQSPISGGTSLHTMAVDCAANCGSISATLHQSDEIGRHCGTRLLRFRIENVQARRAGIEVDIIASVAHRGLAAAVVQAKSAGREIEQAARQSLRDMGHAIFHGDAGAAQQIDDIGRDPYARIFDELESFAENAFNERLIEQLEFRSHPHAGSTTALWVFWSISSRASATALMASLA